MRTVIGIDGDTRKLAWARAPIGNEPWQTGVLVRTNARGDVHPTYEPALAKLCCEWRAAQALVVAESPYLKTVGGRVSNGLLDVFAALCRLQGELESAARRHGLAYETVSPSIWQAAILGGPGSRTDCKRASMALAVGQLGRADLTEDEADAVCIALYAQEGQTQ